MNEIQEISNRIDKEVESITLASTSDQPSREIGGKASARVVKLRNPNVLYVPIGSGGGNVLLNLPAPALNS